MPKKNCFCFKVCKSKRISYFRFGFGNWAEIAELIGSDKKKEDVEEHYVNQYL